MSEPGDYAAIGRAEGAELVAELRGRLAYLKGDELAKLGTMLLNLGADAVIAMHNGAVRAAIVEVWPEADHGGYYSHLKDDEPPDDDSWQGHWERHSFDYADTELEDE